MQQVGRLYQPEIDGWLVRPFNETGLEVGERDLRFHLYRVLNNKYHVRRIHFSRLGRRVFHASGIEIVHMLRSTHYLVRQEFFCRLETYRRLGLRLDRRGRRSVGKRGLRLDCGWRRNRGGCQ